MSKQKLEEHCKWKPIAESSSNPVTYELCRRCDGLKQGCVYYWGKNNVFGFETSADVSFPELIKKLEGGI